MGVTCPLKRTLTFILFTPFPPGKNHSDAQAAVPSATTLLWQKVLGEVASGQGRHQLVQRFATARGMCNLSGIYN